MKKVLVICMALMMVVASCVTAFAAPDSFIVSPGRTEGPALDDFETENPDFSGSLVIVPYKDRDELSTDDLQDMEDAYNSIIDAEDLSQICAGMGELANSMNVPAANLAVKDLFNIVVDNGGVTVDAGKFTVKLDANDIKGFVGLMQFIDGQWTLVSDAKIVDGKLVFSTEELTTFAIVVDATKGAATSPQTGDPMHYVFAGIALLTAATMIYAMFGIYKRKNYE